MSETASPTFGECPICGRMIRLLLAGTVRQHRSATDRLMNCRGWGQFPVVHGTFEAHRRASLVASREEPSQ